MKSRKTRTLVALGLAAISGFSLMMVYAAEKDIKLDPTNARQIIPTIHFRSNISNSGQYVELKNVGNLVRIDTRGYSFVISKPGAGDLNSATGSSSTVLGGIKNKITKTAINPDFSTIIGGEDNKIHSSSATIGGGKGNTIAADGKYGTVAGGEGNTSSKDYATVVGGKSNEAGQYAVALGDTSKANGSNSVAMGKKATVNGDNSFLWSDNGATLGSENVFAVMGGSGMVVNTDTAHRFAQLTIGGSLIINETSKDNSAVCGGGKGKGVVKVVTGSHSQACFCSCNGTKRSSLYGGGDCSSRCDTAVDPKCNNSKLIKDCSKGDGHYTYSGSCEVGDVVEGTGAYMVDKDNIVHWTCQTNDGNTDSCASAVTQTRGSCTERDPVRLGCDGYDNGDYIIPALEHNHTERVTNKAGTCSIEAGCYNGYPTLGEEICYSCQGSYPDGATSSSVAPTSNKNWTCATDLTQACTYTCPSGQHCNDAGNGCIQDQLPKKCSSTHYNCTNDGTASNKKATEGSDRYTWDCPDETGCYEVCPTGQTIQGGSCKVLSSSPACGSATQSTSLDKPAANTLCAAGTPSDPVEAIVGEPGSIGWSWKCDDLDCWTYMPSAEIGCDWVSTPPAVASFFFTPTYEVAGAWVDVRAQVTCGNGATDTINDTFKLDPTSSIGNLLINGVYCGGEGVASIQRVDIVGFSSNQNYNGYRLVAGKSCSDNDAPACGTANGTTRSSAPATYSEKCSVGTPSAIYGGEDGNGWGWTCEQNGNTVPCTAWEYPACGDADGQTVANMPEGTAACNPGYLKAGGGLSSDGSQYEWTCVNGTGQVDCSATAVYNYNIYWSPNYTTERSIYYDLVVKSADTNDQENLPVDTALKSFVSYTANGMEYSNDGYILSLNGDSGNNGKYKIGHVVGSYSDLSFNEVQLTFDNGESTITIDDGGIYNLNLILSGGSSYECIGSQPGDYTIKSPATPISNKNWEYKEGYTQSQLGACQWSCKDSTYERNGTTMNCRKKSYSCQGTPPSGATPSTVAPTSNKDWTCATDLTQACTYTCPSGQHCNDAGNGCIQDQLPKKCSSLHYNCTNDGTASNKEATEGSDRYTWDCPDETGCYEKCEDGQTLHNGVCAKEQHFTLYYKFTGAVNYGSYEIRQGWDFEISVFNNDKNKYEKSLSDSITLKSTLSYYLNNGLDPLHINHTYNISPSGGDCSYDSTKGTYLCYRKGNPPTGGVGLPNYVTFGDERFNDKIRAEINGNTYILEKIGDEPQCGRQNGKQLGNDSPSGIGACFIGEMTDLKFSSSVYTWYCEENGLKSDQCRAHGVVNTYSCIGSFSNAHLVEGTNEGLTENVTSKLYASESAVPAGTKCAYVCNSSDGYDYVPSPNNSSIYVCAKTIRISCDKTTGAPYQPTHTQFPREPKGWDIDNKVTLTLSEAVPFAFTAYVGYDAETKTNPNDSGSEGFDFAANSTSVTKTLKIAHNEGCCTTQPSSEGCSYGGYSFLSNWHTYANSVTVGNTTYNFVEGRNNCGDDTAAYAAADELYCANNTTCYGELKFNIANHGMRDVVVLSYTWWDASGIEHISPFIECEGQEDTIIRSDHGDAICSIGEIPCGSYNGGYINYQYYPYSTDPHTISTDAINLDESGLIYYMITIDD